MPSTHQDIYSHPGPKALKQFKEITLVAFLADVKNLEGLGLTPGQCGGVQEALADVQKVAQGLPNHRPFDSYRSRLEKFRERYVKWNSASDPKSRRHEQVRLASSRQGLVINAVPHPENSRSAELDAIKTVSHETATKLHAALKKIASNPELKNLFPKLTEALNKF